MGTHYCADGTEFFVDDSDDLEVSRRRWMAHRPKISRTVYVISGYSANESRVLLHRMLVGVEGLEVDHIDGNGLNNRRSNLRCCSHAENMRNRRMHKNNTSGYTGVVLLKKTGRWMALIKLNGKSYYVGSYTDPKVASEHRSKRLAELLKSA